MERGRMTPRIDNGKWEAGGGGGKREMGDGKREMHCASYSLTVFLIFKAFLSGYTAPVMCSFSFVLSSPVVESLFLCPVSGVKRRRTNALTRKNAKGEG